MEQLLDHTYNVSFSHSFPLLLFRTKDEDFNSFNIGIKMVMMMK